MNTKTLAHTDVIEVLEAAMIGIGNHASKETDLGIAIDDAWSKLDDIVESLKDGNYNDKGEFDA